MGLANPPIRETAKFSEEIGYNTPFILEGIRVVRAKSADYGEGEMVVIDARGHAAELGVWGTYLIHQARAVESSDLGKRYKMVEDRIVDGFSRRPVKALVPCDEHGDEIPF